VTKYINLANNNFTKYYICMQLSKITVIKYTTAKQFSTIININIICFV